MLIRTLVIFFAAISLTACNVGGPKETGGTYIGAASGALVGSQIGKGKGRLAAVALGTLIGAQVGGSIGRSMDEQDRQMAANSAYNALERQPDNRAVTWRNPNNNHSGSVVATSTNQTNDKVCRDYVHTVNIDGQQEKVYGRACRDLRDARGQWYDVRS